MSNLDVPGPPVNVELENWDKSFAQLKWEKPEKDGGAPILKYVIGSIFCSSFPLLYIYITFFLHFYNVL